MSRIPSPDREYLAAKGILFDEIAQNGGVGIILKQFPLPPGRYDAPRVDILVLLPPGYPDVHPDMFFTLPWVKLLPEGQYPLAADVQFDFNGQRWQRWSRHSGEWRAGRDGIWSFLKRIEHAIAVAQA
jgi:hypothetical protein